MQKPIPEFIQEATNVYRTRKYIVKQKLGIQCDGEENNVVFSRDTYYFRTRQRDNEYESIFYCRRHIDGKRLPSTMFSREHVD